MLAILDGMPVGTVSGMYRSLWGQIGTPLQPVDWSAPDSWIAERLLDGEAELARRIWDRSERTINPRYSYDTYRFLLGHRLLAPDDAGTLRPTDDGGRLLNNDPRLILDLDRAEAVQPVLAILATRSRARPKDLLPEWTEYARQHATFGTDNTIRNALQHRLLNLLERGLVTKDGVAYSATPEGLTYAAETSGTAPDPSRDVLASVRSFNANQREELRRRLGAMPPYRFERLVRNLLEAMGYEDVTVTREAGDKGVDVVATVQFGITTITEVVQVKRLHGSIGRPVVDQLRGALPYFNAIRGTVVSLGTFTKGCKDVALFAGAAPISLIDGEKLLDLLIEHEVGIRKRPIFLHEVDEEAFTPTAEEAQIPDESVP